MLQFHGSLTEIKRAINQERRKTNPNIDFVNYLCLLHDYKLAVINYGFHCDLVKELGEQTTKACVKFNESLKEKKK